MNSKARASVVARLPVPGQDAGVWGNLLNDFLDVAHNSDGTLKTSALADKADKTTVIFAGTGLTGGGDLSVDRTLAVNYGTTAGTTAQGNDSRITGAVQTSTATTKGDLLAATAAASITRLGVGSDGQVLTADSTQTSGLRWAAGTPGPSSPVPVMFTVDDSPLITGVGEASFRVPSALAGTILSVSAVCTTAPTGASIIVDVNKNATTIFTNQSNRPSIAAGATSSSEKTPDVTSVAAGDLLTVDVDQVGSTVAGSGLTVMVVLEPS